MTPLVTNMPALWSGGRRGDAGTLLRVLLRVHGVPGHAATKGGRLLRLLLVRQRARSADAGAK